MKKIMSILILAVFLISIVPFGAAKNADKPRPALFSAGGDAEIECETWEDCPKSRCLGVESKCVDGVCVVPRCGTVNPIAIKNKLQVQNREITREKLQQAKEEYISANTRLQLAKRNGSKEKVEFSKARAELRVCGDENATACLKIRERVQLHAKTYIVKTAERIIAVLEKIKSKVEQSDDLTEEEAQEIIADLEERIAALQEAIDTLESSEDEEEIKEAAQLIKQEWTRTRVRARLHIEKLKSAKLGNIIARAEHLQEKLENIKNNLSESGEDVEGMEDLLEQFNQSIGTAKEKYQTALDLFNQTKEAETGAEKGALVQQAQQYHKEAQNALRQAHNTLKQIVRLIKATEKGTEALEEAEEEEEETEEEEEQEEEETEEAEEE